MSTDGGQQNSPQEGSWLWQAEHPGVSLGEAMSSTGWGGGCPVQAQKKMANCLTQDTKEGHEDMGQG